MLCKEFFSYVRAENSEPLKENQAIKEDGSSQLVVLRVTAENSAYLQRELIHQDRGEDWHQIL